MIERKIQVFFSDLHKIHVPITVFINGRLETYWEVPKRVINILEHLGNTNLSSPIKVETLISIDEITKIHDNNMINYLQALSKSIMLDQEYIYPSVFAIKSPMSRLSATHLEGRYGTYCFDTEAPIGRGTWTSVISSATVASVAASQFISEQLISAYALCRPPGHHAGSSFFGGYCYINNAAIAANKLLDLGNVAIIDLDYHHGNGTQEIFWQNPKVFFGSIHGDPQFEYPYYSGYADEVGGYKAYNTNINIPLPRHTSGEKYLCALADLLQSVSEFNPASLVVSIGFDTYYDDPIGSFQLTIDDYSRIGKSIGQLGVPTLFVQEGGYKASMLGKLCESLVRGYLAVYRV